MYVDDILNMFNVSVLTSSMLIVAGIWNCFVWKEILVQCLWYRKFPLTIFYVFLFSNLYQYLLSWYYSDNVYTLFWINCLMCLYFIRLWNKFNTAYLDCCTQWYSPLSHGISSICVITIFLQFWVSCESVLTHFFFNN